MRKPVSMILGGLILAASVACSASELPGGEEPEPVATNELAAESARELPSPEEWQDVLQRVEARVDSVDRLLISIPNLTGSERGALRRDVNARQTARAQALGIRRGADVEALEERGQLRRLADSTRYWVVRELDYSVPYVTPDTEAMLAELGERWLVELDKLGLPHYRLEITSVLRTPADQARLRRSNPNAASGASAHEFGTTVDIAYRRFAAPASGAEGVLDGVHPALEPQIRILHDSLLVETAAMRGTELQAVLGRILQEMREEGKLLVMMERQQTVYHMTVARSFPARDPVPAE
ncbi:hypothetical protein BH23GEM6_BH23GEM6_19010 [soil metagenome]